MDQPIPTISPVAPSPKNQLAIIFVDRSCDFIGWYHCRACDRKVYLCSQTHPNGRPHRQLENIYQ